MGVESGGGFEKGFCCFEGEEKGFCEGFGGEEEKTGGLVAAVLDRELGAILFCAGFRASWVKGLVASTGPVPWYSQSMGLSKVRCIAGGATEVRLQYGARWKEVKCRYRASRAWLVCCDAAKQQCAVWSFWRSKRSASNTQVFCPCELQVVSGNVNSGG